MATGRLIYLCCSSMTQPGAPTPLGMSDFFALEAGEYLDRLDALLQPPAPPAADELVRLARALRGSALMASQQGIARAAMGFEAFARGVREGRRPWDAATKQIAIRSVDDLKIFVRKAASWTEADTAKAEALASQLEQFGGRPSAQVRAAEAIGLDAGARAFVAREGAAIASALDRAGRALRANPIAHDPLQQVLKALQPLRGLAALNDLPPLPDLLEGIEQAIGAISRTTVAPPAGVGDTIAELFQMAATSIAHAAREVAERGRPDPERDAARATCPYARGHVPGAQLRRWRRRRRTRRRICAGRAGSGDDRDRGEPAGALRRGGAQGRRNSVHVRNGRRNRDRRGARGCDTCRSAIGFTTSTNGGHTSETSRDSGGASKTSRRSRARLGCDARAEPGGVLTGSGRHVDAV